MTVATIAAPCGSPVSAFKPEGTSYRQHLRFQAIDALDQRRPFFVQRPGVQSDAEQSIHDQPRPLLEQGENFVDARFRVVDVAEIDAPIRQVRPDRPRVVAIVALAREDERQVAAAHHFLDALRQQFAHAADHGGFLAAGRPRGVFPIAHLRDTDHWQRHGGQVTRIQAGKKEKSCGPWYRPTCASNQRWFRSPEFRGHAVGRTMV